MTEEKEKFYNYEQSKKLQSRRKKRIFVIGSVFLPIFLIAGFVFFKASNILTIAGSDAGTYKNFEVEKEADRLDILVLGVADAGHDGGFLSDTMILLSFNKRTGEIAMISLPRDILVKMPEHPRPERINYAYALGEQRVPNGGGLTLSKEVVKYVTGVYVDHAVALNFTGFERLIDTFGGVTIYRQTPFIESLQWQGEGNPNSAYWRFIRNDSEQKPVQDPEGIDEGSVQLSEAGPSPLEDLGGYWQFHIPSGRHVLNGEEALYYARSRFGTNDLVKTKNLSLRCNC
jgi:LCP family protein required for cell wall assembly